MLGSDTANWTWGALHIAIFENQSFGQPGMAPIMWLFNRAAPDRVGGQRVDRQRGGEDTNESYLVNWVPSQRMVIDLADLGSSTLVHTTGQSGHAFNENYDSMIEMWTDGEHGPMPWTREQVGTVSVDLLTMTPAR